MQDRLQKQISEIFSKCELTQGTLHAQQARADASDCDQSAAADAFNALLAIGTAAGIWPTLLPE